MSDILWEIKIDCVAFMLVNKGVMHFLYYKRFGMHFFNIFFNPTFKNTAL